MVYFITMPDNKSAIEPFLRATKGRLHFPTEVITYDECLRLNSFCNSIVIFCDIERFNNNQIADAVGLCELIVAQQPKLILNNPSKALGRYELLKALFRQGLNSYDVHRPPLDGKPVRYPVFLRNELDHYGPISTLLNSVEELQNELMLARPNFANYTQVPNSSFSPLIVEFCEVTSYNDSFHKYGAFFLNGKVIPKHLIFSKDWMVKGNTSQEHSGNAVRERHYVDQNPYKDYVKRIFKFAQIEYGRIDFAVSQKGIEVFEINTNPQLLSKMDLQAPRAYFTTAFLEKFVLSLNELVLNTNLQ